MADEEPKKKPKRVVKKIGDVFCVEFGNGYKGYFQFMAKDSEQLGSEVIRAFYTRYPVDYVPVIDEIVKDRVAFYAHTFISLGIWDGIWYKVGKSTDIGIEALDKFYFGTVDDSIHKLIDGKWHYFDVNPLDNWRLWKTNQKPLWNYKLPEEYYDIVESGTAYPYSGICNKMIYGYYNNTNPIYKAIKRHPRPEVDSYLKREHENDLYYYHFKGEYAVREAVVTADGNTLRLTPENPESGRYRLYNKPFGDINWRHSDFITEEDFLQVWNKTN